jgi:hypothetical protein
MSVVKDLKIRARLNVILIEVDERGSEKSGRDKKQTQFNLSMPETTLDKDEWDRRLADATKVLAQGWELDNDAPPKGISTGGVSSLTASSVTLKGFVDTVAESTCGFVYGATREVNTFTANAAQSPVAANFDDVLITAAIAGLSPGIKYYYRAWVNVAGMLTRYGTVRSFTTPLV